MRKLSVLILSVFLVFFGCSDNGDDNNDNPPTGVYFPVIIEEFSHVNCGPCATVSDAVHSILEDYGTDSLLPVFIEYHAEVEYGNDPFYEAAPNVHGDRRAYYYDFLGIENIPQLLIDGVPLSGSDRIDPNRIKTLTEEARQNAKYAVITAEIATQGDSIGFDCTITADSAFAGKLYCFLALKNIHFESAPGSNGITDFHTIAINIEPDMDGVEISLETDEDWQLQKYFAIPPEIEDGQTDGYSFVVIIQNDSREILGANRFDVE